MGLQEAVLMHIAQAHSANVAIMKLVAQLCIKTGCRNKEAGGDEQNEDVKHDQMKVLYLNCMGHRSSLLDLGFDAASGDGHWQKLCWGKKCTHITPCILCSSSFFASILGNRPLLLDINF